MVLNLLSQKGIFKQRGSSKWAHSKLSFTLLKPSFNDLISSVLDESFKSCFTLPAFLQNTSYRTPTPGHTAFNDYFSSEDDFYRHCALKDVGRGLRFSRAMIQTAESSMRFFAASYPIQRLAAADLIIDVAGGFGQTSIFLSRVVQGCKFVVYDYESVVDEGRSQCPADLQFRIAFEAHDMLLPYDRLIDVDVGSRIFLLKQVLHDWGDTECGQILRRIMEALGSAGTILILESVKPLENVSLSTAMSEIMVVSMFGGFHRTYADYERLFVSARSDVSVNCWRGNVGQHDDFLIMELHLVPTA